MTNRKHVIEGYLFILPWLLGFAIFTLAPMLYSLYLSFCEYDPRGIQGPQFVGWHNYAMALANADEKFYLSLKTTAVYAAISIPLGLIGALIIAMLLTRDIKGMAFFRTIFYLPAILPTLAIGMLWYWLLNTDFGLINYLIGKIGFLRIFLERLDIYPIDWLGNEKWVLPAYVLASLWGVGGGMLVLIAAIKNIPAYLYEAAHLDGAGWFHRFFNITLPMLSFVLFFNLIMGIIGAFQVFDIAYIMGGAGNRNLFMVLYLYQTAWTGHKMGYASALAWILFALIFGLSLLVIKSSPAWVYYESER